MQAEIKNEKYLLMSVFCRNCWCTLCIILVVHPFCTVAVEILGLCFGVFFLLSMDQRFWSWSYRCCCAYTQFYINPNKTYADRRS